MKRWIPVSALLVALGTLPALASEATFDRTLSVSGNVTLHISTGSGYIHIRPGSDSRVHIVGRVHSNGWDGDGDRVHQIASAPPIMQTGDIIRVGFEHENLHNISIDYDVEAPAKTYLQASSGSGDVTDDGVGVDARLNTGSGSIHASGLHESFTVETGSGDIFAEQVGSGDVKANTGSGTIELKNVSGGLKAQTGSGDIKLSGAPKADWKVTTGSGTVEIWPSQSAFTLEASTGSGDIKTDREMAVQGSFERHHIVGKINGGGPLVRVETGSGDIRIH
jgi:hypothetical protein